MKRYIEQLARFYYVRHGLKIGIVRPTNIYGPYDKFDDDKSHVLPALIKRALNKENPYVVWGDGYAVRDFIYVEDVVDDLLDVLQRYCTCDPINIGSGLSITISDAVTVILEVCGHHVTPQYDITKPSAIPYRMLNTTKFEAIFGKKPRTEFWVGIEKTVQWYKAITQQTQREC
jgi:GDP-L-fucose synthase